jgi:hypothetical protein
MRQRVPVAWTSFGRGVRGIVSEEPADGRIVAENRRRVDVAAGDFGMRREDRLGGLERAMPEGCVDEFRPRIFGLGHRAASLPRV